LKSFSNKKLLNLMTKLTFSIFAVVLMIACENGNAHKGNSEMTTFLDSVSYTFGTNIGSSFRKDSIDISMDNFWDGLNDAKNGDSLLINDSVAQELMQRFQKFMAEEQQKKFENLKTVNQAKGQEFLDKNKTESGIVITESGLQYKVLTEGNGMKPDSNDRVKVHYTGKLIDGTVFDSSVERGEPAEFAANRVIPGWVEGLQLMSTGAKYMFYIPSELAYGERGAGQNIGPNEVLIFEVELLEVFPQ